MEEKEILAKVIDFECDYIGDTLHYAAEYFDGLSEEINNILDVNIVYEDGKWHLTVYLSVEV